MKGAVLSLLLFLGLIASIILSFFLVMRFQSWGYVGVAFFYFAIMVRAAETLKSVSTVGLPPDGAFWFALVLSFLTLLVANRYLAGLPVLAAVLSLSIFRDSRHEPGLLAAGSLEPGGSVEAAEWRARVFYFLILPALAAAFAFFAVGVVARHEFLKVLPCLAIILLLAASAKFLAVGPDQGARFWGLLLITLFAAWLSDFDMSALSVVSYVGVALAALVYVWGAVMSRRQRGQATG